MHWRCPPVLVQVLVKTSDIKGAGTDANVYLTLFGDWVRGQLLLSPYFVCLPMTCLLVCSLMAVACVF